MPKIQGELMKTDNRSGPESERDIRIQQIRNNSTRLRALKTQLPDLEHLLMVARDLGDERTPPGLDIQARYYDGFDYSGLEDPEQVQRLINKIRVEMESILPRVETVTSLEQLSAEERTRVNEILRELPGFENDESDMIGYQLSRNNRSDVLYAVRDESGQIVSVAVAHLKPTFLNLPDDRKLGVVELSAIATDPEVRGKGYMNLLIREIVQNATADILTDLRSRLSKDPNSIVYEPDRENEEPKPRDLLAQIEDQLGKPIIFVNTSSDKIIKAFLREAQQSGLKVDGESAEAITRPTAQCELLVEQTENEKWRVLFVSQIGVKEYMTADDLKIPIRNIAENEFTSKVFDVKACFFQTPFMVK